MPQNWICVINRENYENVLKHKIWGVNERNKNSIERVQIGDNLIFYIIKERVLGGIFRVSKRHFRSLKKIFGGGIYPFRVGIEEVFIPKGSIPFVELGWKLRKRIKFIPDHDRWASIFRRTLISISDEDFQILSNIIKNAKWIKKEIFVLDESHLKDLLKQL